MLSASRFSESVGMPPEWWMGWGRELWQLYMGCESTAHFPSPRSQSPPNRDALAPPEGVGNSVGVLSPLSQWWGKGCYWHLVSGGQSA
jgi:hypothetical protein